MIKELTIKNFRGLQLLERIQCDKFNIFIGDNGTSKTTILEALNHAFSPNFLAGKIKHTDFTNGMNEPIDVFIHFNKSIEIELPDGYSSQAISCDKLFLRIKKREKKRAGKIFSDLVTLEHILVPDFPRRWKRWLENRTQKWECIYFYYSFFRTISDHN